MKAPHEETWEVRKAGRDWQVRCESKTWLNADPPEAEAHCRLAAAAPEMARMLVRLRDYYLHDADYELSIKLGELLKKAGVI